MKYKSSSYSHLNDPRINNMITTVNLKIKDIHILFDDVDTYNMHKKNLNKKSYSISKNIESSPNSTLKSQKIYYHKKNIQSFRNSRKKMRTIPINLKKNVFNLNNSSTPQSLSNTFDVNNFNSYNSKDSSFNSQRNNIINGIPNINTDRILYIKKIKNINNFIEQSNKRKIYYRNNYFSSNRKPTFLTSVTPRNFIHNRFCNKTMNLESNKINNYKNVSNHKFNIKRKIKFNCINYDQNNKKKYFYILKNCLIIQSWWKNIKQKSVLKYFIIMVQKIFRGYIFRKNYKYKYSFKTINKYNNKLHYITKCYYKNALQIIILLQREIRKFLMRVKLYQIYHFNNSSNCNKKTYLDIPYNQYINFPNQKPIYKICYISKIIKNNKSINSNNSLSLIKTKIKSIIKNKNNRRIKIDKDKDDNKIIFINKSLIESSPNLYNKIINEKNINFINNMLTIQTIDSRESQDGTKFDFFRKNSNNAYYFLQNFFKNNIIHKLYLILLKMKYNHINLSNFITDIFNAIIKYNKRKFFERISLSLYYNNEYKSNFKRKENLIKIILRHINIYKKNNFTKNEVIDIIKKYIPEYLDINELNMKNKNALFNFSSESIENNLINAKIFNNNNNLINYIYLFFKYEKNKNFVNYNFIQNRLMKEPLNYRNIFTITRYIDNLDEKISNNKICMKCFCKNNEKKCMLNCNCHSTHNTTNVNGNCNNNFVSKNKIRKSSLKKFSARTNPIKNGKENNDINGINRKGMNKNIYSLDIINKNNINAESDECQESETINASNISEHNLINEIHVNTTSNYFGNY